MVEALPAVLARHPGARLVVAGKVYYDVFLRRAEELGIAYAVRPLGAVPKSSIPHLLAAATLESHEQGDGLGTATLEAMAAGVPVVGWGRLDNFPGVALRDGGEVLLTHRGDVPGLAQRLLRVLDDPQSAREMGECGRASSTPTSPWSGSLMHIWTLSATFAPAREARGASPGESRNGRAAYWPAGSIWAEPKESACPAPCPRPADGRGA